MIKNKIDINKTYPFIFTFIFIGILINYKFAGLESFFYDLRIKLSVHQNSIDDIVLVAMNEETDKAVGQRYPFNYRVHHRFLHNLIKQRPKIINYFIELEEPENLSDDKELLSTKNLLLRYVERGGRFHFATTMDSWGENIPPLELRELGYSLGLLHVDSLFFAKDEVCRKALLKVSEIPSIHTWTYQQYIEKNMGAGQTDIKGSYYSKSADATFAYFKYFESPLEKESNLKKISFESVLNSNVPDDFFKGKIVLIGPQYLSRTSDFILTPFNKEIRHKTPKLNVHAQIISALIHGNTIQALPIIYTNIFCFILALFLGRVILKVSPSKGLFISSLTIISILVISFLVFIVFNVWIYIIHMILSVFIVYYIWIPYRAILEYHTRYKMEEDIKIKHEVDGLKHNFISLIGHDLKTPVAKVSGIADVLSHSGKLDAESNLLVSQINEATKELDEYITSILDLIKVEANELEINKTPTDINQIIQVITDKLRYEASTKSVSFKLHCQPLYPIEVDQKLMGRVLANLIENAIKYCYQNGEIEIKTWDDSKWVYVSITDQGPGIQQADLPYIFDKFYRVKSDANQLIKGRGLGLYLVKYFVELHDGAIEAKSQVDKGTSFIIKLNNA